MPVFEYEYVTFERSNIPEGESENDYMEHFTKHFQGDGYKFLVAHNEQGPSAARLCFVGLLSSRNKSNHSCVQ